MDLWILAGVPATSFIVALAGAIMPGPLLTVTVGETARRGFWAGPLIMVGHALLELVLVVLLLAGVGTWLDRPTVLGLTGILGAAMLGWMGLTMMRSSRHSCLEVNAQAQSDQVQSGLHLMVTGVLFSVANPCWLIWWLTIGLGYVLFSWKYGLAGIVLFYVGHILADFVWYSLVSGVVAQGRHFISDRLYQGFQAFCGLFLVGFGGYLGFQGVTFLLR